MIADSTIIFRRCIIEASVFDGLYTFAHSKRRPKGRHL